MSRDYFQKDFASIDYVPELNYVVDESANHAEQVWLIAREAIAQRVRVRRLEADLLAARAHLTNFKNQLTKLEDNLK